MYFERGTAKVAKESGTRFPIRLIFATAAIVRALDPVEAREKQPLVLLPAPVVAPRDAGDAAAVLQPRVHHGHELAWMGSVGTVYNKYYLYRF